MQASSPFSITRSAVAASGRALCVNDCRDLSYAVRYGFVSGDTRRAHGPAERGERWWYGAAEWDGRRNPADCIRAR